MRNEIRDLERFQEIFKRTINYTPTLVDKEEYELRHSLSEEENNEYLQACKDGDMVEILDAIVDKIFLAIGDAVVHGLQDVLVPAFAEVVRSNMSKLDTDGKPLINGVTIPLQEDKPYGKVLKSIHYSPPDLKKFL